MFIDYGHEQKRTRRHAAGSARPSLRAVLERPGEQDLTAHVDFEAAASAAREAGAAVTKVVPQGEWLKRLGIEPRAAALSNFNPERADNIRSALERLTAAGQMGELFKVIAIHSPDWPVPAGFQ